jgi:hypothetical protein
LATLDLADPQCPRRRNPSSARRGPGGTPPLLGRRGRPETELERAPARLTNSGWRQAADGSPIFAARERWSEEENREGGDEIFRASF